MPDLSVAVKETRAKVRMDYEDYQEAEVAYDSEVEEEQIKAKFVEQGYTFITKVHDRGRPGYWRLQFGKPKS